MSAVRPRNADDFDACRAGDGGNRHGSRAGARLRLGDFGFGVRDPRSKTPEERAADLLRNRDLIREPKSLAQFMAARGWLRRFGKIRALNRRGTNDPRPRPRLPSGRDSGRCPFWSPRE